MNRYALVIREHVPALVSNFSAFFWIFEFLQILQLKQRGSLSGRLSGYQGIFQKSRPPQTLLPKDPELCSLGAQKFVP